MLSIENAREILVHNGELPLESDDFVLKMADDFAIRGNTGGGCGMFLIK